VIYVFLKWK